MWVGEGLKEASERGPEPPHERIFSSTPCDNFAGSTFVYLPVQGSNILLTRCCSLVPGGQPLLLLLLLLPLLLLPLRALVSGRDIWRVSTSWGPGDMALVRGLVIGPALGVRRLIRAAVGAWLRTYRSLVRAGPWLTTTTATSRQMNNMPHAISQREPADREQMAGQQARRGLV